MPRSELDRLALAGEVPVDSLDLHSRDSFLAEELERVQVPAAFAALEVAGARAELIGPERPGRGRTAGHRRLDRKSVV